MNTSLNSNLNIVCETKVYNLSSNENSCTPLNGDAKSFMQFNIPALLGSVDDSIAAVYFSIPYAVVPNSFYNVNSTNNVLYVQDILIGTLTTYTFPVANYGAGSFITVFRNVMGANNFDITASATTGKFTITSKAANVAFLGNSPIAYVMGFGDDLILPLNQAVQLPRVVNFSALERVCLRCSELGAESFVGKRYCNDVLISMPNNSKPFGTIFFVNSQKTQFQLRNWDLQSFYIKITDDDGHLLDMNGIDSYFTLQFDIYRRWDFSPPTRFHSILLEVNQRNTIYSGEGEGEDLVEYNK